MKKLSAEAQRAKVAQEKARKRKNVRDAKAFLDVQKAAQVKEKPKALRLTKALRASIEETLCEQVRYECSRERHADPTGTWTNFGWLRDVHALQTGETVSEDMIERVARESLRAPVIVCSDGEGHRTFRWSVVALANAKRENEAADRIEQDDDHQENAPMTQETEATPPDLFGGDKTGPLTTAQRETRERVLTLLKKAITADPSPTSSFHPDHLKSWYREEVEALSLDATVAHGKTMGLLLLCVGEQVRWGKKEAFEQAKLDLLIMKRVQERYENDCQAMLEKFSGTWILANEADRASAERQNLIVRVPSPKGNEATPYYAWTDAVHAAWGKKAPAVDEKAASDTHVRGWLLAKWLDRADPSLQEAGEYTLVLASNYLRFCGVLWSYEGEQKAMDSLRSSGVLKERDGKLSWDLLKAEEAFGPREGFKVDVNVVDQQADLNAYLSASSTKTPVFTVGPTAKDLAQPQGDAEQAKAFWAWYCASVDNRGTTDLCWHSTVLFAQYTRWTGITKAPLLPFGAFAAAMWDHVMEICFDPILGWKPASSLRARLGKQVASLDKVPGHLPASAMQIPKDVPFPDVSPVVPTAREAELERMLASRNRDVDLLNNEIDGVMDERNRALLAIHNARNALRDHADRADQAWKAKGDRHDAGLADAYEKARELLVLDDEGEALLAEVVESAEEGQ